jgi:hypothetical protein
MKLRDRTLPVQREEGKIRNDSKTVEQLQQGLCFPERNYRTGLSVAMSF